VRKKDPRDPKKVNPNWKKKIQNDFVGHGKPAFRARRKKKGRGGAVL